MATDHDSLVTVLGDQSLTDAENPRLARIKERILWWQFKIIHTPGKLQLAADALLNRKWKLPSNLHRLSAADSDVDKKDIIDDLQLRLKDLYDCSAKIHSVMRGDTVKVITQEKLYEAVHEDQVLLTWFRHDLHVVGGVVCYKNRAVNPAALRPQHRCSRPYTRLTRVSVA